MESAYSAEALAAALGHTFPIRVTSMCKAAKCRKNFMWMKRSATETTPEFCPDHKKTVEPFKKKMVQSNCRVCGERFSWKKLTVSMKSPGTCKTHRETRKCPTPRKTKLSSKASARAYVTKSMIDRNKVLYVYHCSCGSYHITSKKRSGRTSLDRY